MTGIWTNLKHITTSHHFVFHYALRSYYANPGVTPQGVPLPFDGVPNLAYVGTFKNALERYWFLYERAGWRFPKKQVHVYFRNLQGVNGQTLYPALCIELPSRHEDTFGPCNKALVKAVTAHELFHVVQGGLKPECFYEDSDWAWFAEASATFMQTRVVPNDREYLWFLYSWLDQTELPLDLSLTDDSIHAYGGFLFCQFLHEKFPKNNTIQKVWKSAAKFNCPLKAIQHHLPKQSGSAVRLASATSPDLFASEFLSWNFFLESRPSLYRQGIVLRNRFQHAFAGAALDLRQTVETSGTYGELGHLGARYHLIRLPHFSGWCKIQLDVKASDCPRAPGKGVVHLIRANPGGGESVAGPLELTLKSRTSHGQFSGILRVRCSVSKRRDGYILVIVANTTWGANRRSIQSYTLSVKREP
jgi:hypothetical protein